MGRVFLVASGKGGTGKTMFATNFGATLAMKGKHTVIVDLDLGLRNLDLYFGMENNVVYDVYDVLNGNCRIKQALIKDKRFNSLYVMAASPTGDDGSLTPLHMKILCDKLSKVFDYVIIDAPSGISDGLELSAAGADSAVIVTTPEYAAIRDADLVDRELMRMGIRDRAVVLNRVVVELMSAGYAPRIREVSSMLMPPIAGVIQEDQNIHISTNLGLPIVLKGNTYIRSNFIKITERIVKKKY